MAFKGQLIIQRPPEQVWAVFTTPETWKTWWGGFGLSQAEWEEGGHLVWGIGSCSTILELEPAKLIYYKLDEVDYTKATRYTFEAQAGGGSTLVTVQEENSTVAADDARKTKELADELARLKALVEGA